MSSWPLTCRSTKPAAISRSGTGPEVGETVPIRSPSRSMTPGDTVPAGVMTARAAMEVIRPGAAAAGRPPPGSGGLPASGGHRRLEPGAVVADGGQPHSPQHPDGPPARVDLAAAVGQAGRGRGGV